MSQTQVRAAVPLTIAVLETLDRVARATRSAASAVTSATKALHAEQHALGGARVERAEKLLQMARKDLAVAITSLRKIQLDGVADGPIRWDTPPPTWWMTCANELRTYVDETLNHAERIELAWKEQRQGMYTDLVRRMADEAKSLRDGWDLCMQRTKHWREVVVAVDDGLPASHSVVRALPL